MDEMAQILAQLTGKPIGFLQAVDASVGKYSVSRPTKVKVQPAQKFPPELRDELVKICIEHKQVRACELLDVLQPNGDMQLFVSLALEAKSDLDIVAPVLREALRLAPKYSGRYFIGAEVFGEVRPERAIYTRP